MQDLRTPYPQCQSEYPSHQVEAPQSFLEQEQNLEGGTRAGLGVFRNRMKKFHAKEMVDYLRCWTSILSIHCAACATKPLAEERADKFHFKFDFSFKSCLDYLKDVQMCNYIGSVRMTSAQGVQCHLKHFKEKQHSIFSESLTGSLLEAILIAAIAWNFLGSFKVTG